MLQFERISKCYGDTQALADVSFEVGAGEIFGLLGPNGAGKTTLFRILLDIIRSDSGRIFVFGEPRKREHLDRIGYLPEERGLYQKQKVIDVLTYFGTLKGLTPTDARRRSFEWLDRIGLSEVASHRVRQLSKGMSQKVQVAAALLFDPDLCVLDEPLSGLDPVNARMVRELIRRRREDGRTTILSSHQMSLVESLCDRVALLHHGRLVEYGATLELRQRYSRAEVRIETDVALPDLSGVEGLAREGPGVWRASLRKDASPQGLLHELLERNIHVKRFEEVLTPLDDIFVHIVEHTGA